MVKRKNVLLLLSLEIINIIAFIIGRVISPLFEVMPFLYAVDGIICLTMYLRRMGYNVEDNLISAYVERQQYGYVMFDNKRRFLGCTTAAEEIFPDLKYCIVDKKIDHIESLSLINEWIDRYSDKIEEEFYYEKGDKYFECKIKRIWNKNKAHGYIFEICEDTDKWKYLELIKNYNAELEKKQQEVIRAEILRCKGTQFDPEIADIMVELIDEDKEYTLKQADSAKHRILVVDVV